MKKIIDFLKIEIVPRQWDTIVMLFLFVLFIIAVSIVCGAGVRP